MKKTQTQRIAASVAESNGKITVGEFCSMFIPRYSARLHELKKILGISWTITDNVYQFSIETRQKCREYVYNEFQEGLQEVVIESKEFQAIKFAF